jgi:hypothetical protein
MSRERIATLNVALCAANVVIWSVVAVLLTPLCFAAAGVWAVALGIAIAIRMEI